MVMSTPWSYSSGPPDSSSPAPISVRLLASGLAERSFTRSAMAGCSGTSASGRRSISTWCRDGAQGKIDPHAGQEALGPRPRGHHRQGGLYPIAVGDHGGDPAARDLDSGDGDAGAHLGAKLPGAAGVAGGDQIGVGVAGLRLVGEGLAAAYRHHRGDLANIIGRDQPSVDAEPPTQSHILLQGGPVPLAGDQQVARPRIP